MCTINPHTHCRLFHFLSLKIRFIQANMRCVHVTYYKRVLPYTLQDYFNLHQRTQVHFHIVYNSTLIMHLILFGYGKKLYLCSQKFHVQTIYALLLVREFCLRKRVGVFQTRFDRPLAQGLDNIIRWGCLVINFILIRLQPVTLSGNRILHKYCVERPLCFQSGFVVTNHFLITLRITF